VFSLPAERWAGAFCVDPARFIAPRPGMEADQLLRVARNREAAALFGWSPHMANAKLGQRLHRVRRPTLLISGESDAIAPADYFAEYASALPGARHRALAGCGHLVHADAPEAFAEQVFAFGDEEGG
jgi:pimeloyl-ACP methyl ester carboxylesterase